jgi:hypothetical protein
MYCFVVVGDIEAFIEAQEAALPIMKLEKLVDWKRIKAVILRQGPQGDERGEAQTVCSRYHTVQCSGPGGTTRRRLYK